MIDHEPVEISANIQSNANLVSVYCAELYLKELFVETDTEHFDKYNDDLCECAMYDEQLGTVYAESLLSMETAMGLVVAKTIEMRDLFTDAAKYCLNKSNLYD